MERMEWEVKAEKTENPFSTTNISFKSYFSHCSACVPFSRFCELSDWLSSQKRQLRLLKEATRTSSHQEHIDAAVQVSWHFTFLLYNYQLSCGFVSLYSCPAFPFQEMQEALEAREERMLWLKSRLAVLSEVSSELEVQRQRTALAKLSTDLQALYSSLCQVCWYILKTECLIVQQLPDHLTPRIHSGVRRDLLCSSMMS